MDFFLLRFIPLLFSVSIEVKWSEVAQSCPTPCDPVDTRLLHPWDFLGKSTGVGCHFLLQGIFPTQGLNPGLPPCRQTLHRLSHQGSPGMYTNTCISIQYFPPSDWLHSVWRTLGPSTSLQITQFHSFVWIWCSSATIFFLSERSPQIFLVVHFCCWWIISAFKWLSWWLRQ